MNRVKIKVKRPWVAYPGTPVQQNYAETLKHGYLLWDIKGKNSFDVKFHELQNIKPYVTIDWQGDVASTVETASEYPKGSRFRIFNPAPLAQKDVVQLSAKLRRVLQAAEVTFKTEEQVNREAITANDVVLVKDDLRNIDVLCNLVKEYHKKATVTEVEWNSVRELLTKYVATVNQETEIVRNTKWSLKKMEFDNIFGYGEGNVIDFAALDGIVGIFGPNRLGKSSIIGSMMYSLFNTTDRGSLKNLHVINVRKSQCYTKATLGINGVDYLIERQTAKHENKKGQINANTSLNFYKVDENGSLVDLVGEQRSDTEKVVRNLIGTPDDILLTTISAQEEINQFIKQGTSKRQQVLSRFLDLDVIFKIHDLANKDLNANKVALRTFPERDFKQLVATNDAKLASLETETNEHDEKVHSLRFLLARLNQELASHQDIIPVTEGQVNREEARVTTLKKQVLELQQKIETISQKMSGINERITKIDDLKKDYDITALKRKQDAFNVLKSSVQTLKHAYDKEAGTLTHQQRSLKLLDEVPCGDQFPTCKFIKDAHVNKAKIEKQRVLTERSHEELTKAEAALEEIQFGNTKDSIDKLEKLNDLRSKLAEEVSSEKIKLLKLETEHTKTKQELDKAEALLVGLVQALNNQENAAVVDCRIRIDNTTKQIQELEEQKLSNASMIGRLRSDNERLHHEQEQRDNILQQMRAFDLIETAFSKKAVPAMIVASQLPMINAEISRILQGIVDFTIELAVDETDDLEIYINYGDSQRIIELCSGMEKVVASIAIRVALINVSTLPRADILVLDEPFGPLDEAGIEACSRLLVSLKRYFRATLFVTHIPELKDVADQLIEITKHEKDARVVFGSK